MEVHVEVHWQSGAFDPETGILYVQPITTPFTAGIVKPSGKSDLNYVSGTRAWTPGPQGLPLFKRPAAASPPSI